MENLKEYNGKDVELLSNEVQEVMNRIPSTVVRFRMTIMALILSGILITTAYIKCPKTIESSFEGLQVGNIVELKTSLSDETLNYLLQRDGQSICIYSPMFQQKYSSNEVTGIIAKISIVSRSNDKYNTVLTVVLNNDKLAPDSIFYGDVRFIVLEKTLLQSIIEGLNLW